jgi:co-chaperonin GroES (HSP10)
MQLPTLNLTNDNILLKLEPLNQTVDGLSSDVVLFKPTDACEHVYRTATVVKLGPGKRSKKHGIRLPMDLRVGDRVIFIKFLATHTSQSKQLRQEILGDDYAIVKESDILAEIGDLDISRISQ